MRLATFIPALSALSAFVVRAVETDSGVDESAAPAVAQASPLYRNASHYQLLGPVSSPELTTDLDHGPSTGGDEVEDLEELETRATANCFPALGFTPPKGRPPSIPAYKWWCGRETEYAFLGFSYSVSGCPSKSKMAKDFTQMRQQYRARYVRIYGACESNHKFYNNVVNAAYESGVGVYALVWFGFNGPSDKNWEGQLNGLISVVKSNRYAPYVIRDIAIGSEALFDSAISPGNLANRITRTRVQVRPMGVHVTTSEMAYKLAQNLNVLNAADKVQLNLLPFFSQTATTGNSTSARAQVLRELNQMRSLSAGRKKLTITQTGWPSTTAVWKPNSPRARASISDEQKYYSMMDGLCSTFKKYPLGGAAWFAHIWEDNELPGWGIVKNGKAKIQFKARTSC